MADEKKYQRLPGSSKKNFGLFNSTRFGLWLGEDHLLYVQAKSYSETSRRFYFNDIQALIVTATNSGRVASAVLGGLAGVMAIWALAGDLIIEWNLAWTIVFGGIAGIFLMFLIINAAMGPTCVTLLFTAVQVERIVCLSRLRTARRTVETLRRQIESVQGPLTPQVLETQSPDREVVAASSHAEPVIPATPAYRGVQPDETRHEHGRYHEALFFMCLALALSSAIDIFWQHKIKNHIDSLLILPFIVLAIIALVKQRKSDLPNAVTMMPWINLAVLVVAFIASAILVFIYAVSNPDFFRGAGGWDQTLFTPEFVVLFALQAAAWAILGMMGLSRLYDFRAQYRELGSQAQTAGGERRV